jgi:hypothetical protein
MCDWLAQISGVGSALAGLDMAMPGMSTALPSSGFEMIMLVVSSFTRDLTFIRRR